jgi:hypothetical protein
MNKNTILLSGLVVLCIVVITVINIVINAPEKEISADSVKVSRSVRVHQHGPQPKVPAPANEQEPTPQYEATVNNGTILF